MKKFYYNTINKIPTLEKFVIQNLHLEQTPPLIIMHSSQNRLL